VSEAKVEASKRCECWDGVRLCSPAQGGKLNRYFWTSSSSFGRTRSMNQNFDSFYSINNWIDILFPRNHKSKIVFFVSFRSKWRVHSFWNMSQIFPTSSAGRNRMVWSRQAASRALFAVYVKLTHSHTNCVTRLWHWLLPVSRWRISLTISIVLRLSHISVTLQMICRYWLYDSFNWFEINYNAAIKFNFSCYVNCRDCRICRVRFSSPFHVRNVYVHRIHTYTLATLRTRENVCALILKIVMRFMVRKIKYNIWNNLTCIEINLYLFLFTYPGNKIEWF